MSLREVVCVLLFFGMISPGNVAGQERMLPAFPGAEGFGMFTPGGRGGSVFVVTSLADYEDDETPVQGSLRAAIEAEGPRTVVFRVAGNIELKRRLEINEPYLTVTGQTSPGGITLKNHVLEIDAPHVVIRHLRIRPGDVSGEELDAINIQASHVILDHVSASWGTDETISITGGARYVTLQWCLIAESLNRSVHHKGAHGYGTLISGADNVSIHHSVYAFHRSRNPRPKDVLLDFRNNLIYGFGDRAGYNEDDMTYMNYVANYLYPLPYSKNPERAFFIGGTNTRIFLEGNLLHDRLETLHHNWTLMHPPEELGREEAEALIRVDMPLPTPSVETQPATAVPALLLEHVGATRPLRDAVDQRIVELIRSGEGRIIDSQDEVGGWPMFSGSPPPPDEDLDGMSDVWERQYGLDPNDATDHRGDADRDGYTNLEEYLNETNPVEAFSWMPPPVISPPSGTAFPQDGQIEVTIVPPESGLTVRYTVDGSEPTSTSPRYTGPISITADAHVRARIIEPGTLTTAAYAAYASLPWVEGGGVEPQTLHPGLRYTYYEAPDWDEAPPIHSLPVLAEGIATHPDAELRRRDPGYAILFEGYLYAPHDGIYTFYLMDDTRSRLYLDDTFVTPGSERGERSGQIALRSGFHRLLLRSLHEVPNLPIELYWETEHTGKQRIPADVFWHESSGAE